VDCSKALQILLNFIVTAQLEKEEAFISVFKKKALSKVKPGFVKTRP